VKLYEIPLAWSSVELALEEAAGELTPDLEARIKALLEGGSDKLEAAMKVCRSLEAQAEVAKTEAQRLQGRAKSFDNQVERLRSLMLPALQALGGKVKTPLFSFFTTTRTNVLFSMKPGAEIFELPPRFYRAADPELNKAELKKAEAAGEPLPDCLAVVKTESVSMTVR
jgi:hypothetical protein